MMDQERCDLIVIGSGFGGSVSALRAAEAGLRVVVLERGRRLTPRVFEDLAQGRASFFRSDQEPGLLDLNRSGGLLAVTANAVGGGSNVYTAVTVPAPPEVFSNHWPAGFDRDAIAPCYKRVAAMIAPSPIPTPLARTTVLEALGRQMNTTVTRLPLAMNWPRDVDTLHAQPSSDGFQAEVTTWLKGGRAASKRTLDQTYLARAESLGADLRALHEVQAIIPERDGYCVSYRCRRDGYWQDGSIGAQRVVVAAGTLNTVRLLLRCRDLLRTLPDLSWALGQRFFTNGDFGGLLVGSGLSLTPDAGPPVTAWLDRWVQDRLYLMETGLLPFDVGSLPALLLARNWSHGLCLPPARRCTWSFGVMGYHDNPGKLVLDRRGALAHAHRHADGAAYHERTLARLRELAEAAGARLIVPPAVLVRRLPITIHPLGGAAMADSPDRGVTDPRGEVFGYRRLYVADGSLLPTPTGVAPSMTIAALAEHVAASLLEPC